MGEMAAVHTVEMVGHLLDVQAPGVAHEPEDHLAESQLIGIVALAGQDLGHTRVAPIVAGQVVGVQRLVVPRWCRRADATST